MLKKYVLKVVALAVVAVSFLAARPGQISDAEKNRLAAQFAFAKFVMPVPAGEAKGVRNVHPQYKHIAAWISSVGAAVSLDDLDGDGFSNEVVHVDPRYDQILISSVAGIKQKAAPAVLAVRSLPYDPSTMAPMGTLTYDFNEDGRTDILAYFWGRSPVLFLKNAGGYREVELSPDQERWFTNAATLADYDGDGHVDILVTNYFPDGARVLDAHATDDGQTMQHSMSRAGNGGTNHFFLFAGKSGEDPVYREDLDWSDNIANPNDWTLGVATADFTGDLLPEVYLANDFGPDKFLLNQSRPGKLRFKLLYGEKKLTTIASNVLGKDSYKGMGAGIGDLNNDGLLDIYVSNIAAEYALEESHFAFINTGQAEKYRQGTAPFTNESERLGLSRSSWGWDSKLGDFNNDGVLEAVQATGFMKGDTDRWPELQELALGNDNMLASPVNWPKFQVGDDLSGDSHVHFFARNASGKFFDVGPDVGFGEPTVSRGIAIGDVDNDGDEDCLVANQWQDSYLYENKRAAKNDFVGLKLFHATGEGGAQVRVNPPAGTRGRYAVGAVVNLYEGDKLVKTGFVDGGNGHSGSNSKDVFFGVGQYRGKLSAAIGYIGKKGEKKRIKIDLDRGWTRIVLP